MDLGPACSSLASISLPERMTFVRLEVAQESVTPRDEGDPTAKHLLLRSLAMLVSPFPRKAKKLGGILGLWANAP